MQNKTQLILLIFLTLILAACGGAGQDTALEGSQWQLVFIESGAIPPGAQVTLNFQDGQVSGTAACNHYGGSYVYSQDGAFTVETMFMTEMYCMEEPLNQLESAYLRTLSSANSAKIEGDELILIGEMGQLVFGLR